MFFGEFSLNLPYRENILWKIFAKTFRKKLTKFRENQFTFVKVFVFAKGQKRVFVPTLILCVIGQCDTKKKQRKEKLEYIKWCIAL
jgi:hypothetical protein